MLRSSLLKKKKTENILSRMEREVAFDWPIWDALNRVTSEGVLIYVNKQTNDWKLVSVSGIQHIPLSLYTSKFQFVGRKFHMAKAQFLNNWMLRFSMLRTTRNNISSCMKWEVPFDWPISDALNRVTSVGVSIYVNEKREANAHIREAIHMARLRSNGHTSRAIWL